MKSHAALLTTGEAGRYLGISSERVRQLERSGQLPATRTINGIRLFTSSTVEGFRRRRQQKRAVDE